MEKIELMPPKNISEQIQTNYLGALHVIKTNIRYLKESQGSLLLFTSSSYTRRKDFYSVYSSSKATIVNLAQELVEELANDKILTLFVNRRGCEC